MDWVALSAATALAIAGCSKDGGGGAALEFTPAAMKALPSLRPGGSSSTTLTATRSSAANVGSEFFVEQLFKMQCRHRDGGGVDYCPPGTPPPPPDAFDPYQFTMQSLIGFIFHAQMYTSLVTDCSGGSLAPKTVTAASYRAASSAAAADPTRFVLDEFSTYTCRASNVSNGSAETRMVSAVADGSYQTTLHTRYGYDAGDGRPQTDFFQVDVSMNGGAAEFLALNFASATPFASRLVLLANLATHRFAFKYYTPATSGIGGTAPARFAVAAGVGGYDLATGAPNPGHYYIDFLGEAINGETKGCVDNAGGEILSDSTSCALDGVPMDWTGSDAIATYLGVPAAHAARLAPFLAVFQAAATLGPTDAWQSAADEDLYWPASLP